MQFMPCTFVGWKHPSCSGLGKGNISKTELMSPEAIKNTVDMVWMPMEMELHPYDIEDAIYSAANYLSKNGAANGDVKQAVFQYNHSDEYVEKVLHYFNLYNDYHDELKQAVLLNDKK